ncbi:DUF222 domain-containing protein [Gordonia rubripertincta]|uniref:DUF222 domain-containing protein n=2 Tax=Gordonia rubripertincta TaxID=36822 RepID=A0AAW6REB0_GORRU|nr:HNH endonuclease signature motif containing protein [Gordonia rubripertincta]MDG6782861.1 DUF222 domain-containing protein [Gordonia rubripertincta]NKY65166.1 DUF222 domain-containing protein [Gordonia rubripertincta]GAB87954.1 hypothetical protein GORBP_122_00320 [Gordonia rubripertincta NBRC 101908]
MAFEFGDTTPTGDLPGEGFDVLEPLAGLSAEALVSTAAYSASMNAVNTCRILMAASLLHEQREEEYLLHRSWLHTGQAQSVDELLNKTANAAAGVDPYAEHGPNGFEQATAELGAALNLTAAEARDLIRTGDAMRYRLPLTGTALACARIDLRRFTIALTRTDFVDDATMPIVDAHLAEAILARDPMSTTRFTALVDQIVHKHAPDAVRRRNDHATRDREVTIRPDRFQPGRSRITGNLPHTDAAALNAQLTAIATTVHPSDGRTMSQRRADALLALAHGRRALDCHCPDCAPEPAEQDLDTLEPTQPVETEAPADEPADTSPSCSCAGHGPRPTFHIIGNLSTLVGLDNDPGMLDGHGLIDADTMRSLLADAICDVVTAGVGNGPSDADAQAAAAASRYVPSRKLQSLVRAGELCCTFPGCNQPVWISDLDHTHPFDHTNPDHGGKTSERNLKPLCRFHHRIKTFGAWQDSQDEYMSIWFESPTGHVYQGNSFTGRDLFGALTPRKPPDHPARQRIADDRAARTTTHRRKLDEWDIANPPPF